MSKISKAVKADKQSEVSVDLGVKRFTYDEIKAILCEGCKLNLTSLRECDGQKWYHTLNGEAYNCLANDFRSKVNA